ncbi:hypothetical protein DIPPA_06553 [Diplonema papillatum]|nr:hypothetical protein DIPPA_06553 [Diplonema papillatum]
MNQLLRAAPLQTSPSRFQLTRTHLAAIGLVLLVLFVVGDRRMGHSSHHSAGMATVPVKHAVAIVIRNPKNPYEVLTVRRSSDDAELPGAVGLPSGYVEQNESHEEAVRHHGMEKLGLALEPTVKFVGRGRILRRAYVLEMEEFEVTLLNPEAVPSVPHGSRGTPYASWAWQPPSALLPAAEEGSLCSRIFLTKNGHREYPLL